MRVELIGVGPLKKTIVATCARAFFTALLIGAGACSSSPNPRPHVAGGVIVVPRGIAPFKNADAAVKAGLYPGNEATCCFLAPKAHLTLDKPVGDLHATLNFFVPNVGSHFDGETVTVAVGGESVTGSLKEDTRRIVLTMQLPQSYESQTSVPVTITATKSIVPKELGLNGDPRRLGVILVRVDYR